MNGGAGGAVESSEMAILAIALGILLLRELFIRVFAGTRR